MLKKQDKKIVLIAAIGTSPAVLTETVWAMAHGRDAVIPDQIEVVTTLEGKKQIEEQLLSGEPSVWDLMIRALKAEHLAVPDRLRFGRACIAVIPDERGNEAEDLRSPGDNLRAADVMLGVVRKYTTNDENIVYASIAGGRKSMSALMFSCMSLLGRTCDHVTHVLTTPDAVGMKSLKDGGTFYYPKKGHTYEHGPRDDRQKIAAGKIAIELFEVPFVRMRGWYQEKFGTIPPSYGTLVNAVQMEAPPAEEVPMVSLDLKAGTLRIGESDCPLKPQCLVMAFAYLFEVSDQVVFLNGLSALRERSDGERKTFPIWFKKYLSSKRSGKGMPVDEHDIANFSSELRKALRGRLSLDLVERLCPKRGGDVKYPKNRREILNRDVIPSVEA